MDRLSEHREKPSGHPERFSVSSVAGLDKLVSAMYKDALAMNDALRGVETNVLTHDFLSDTPGIFSHTKDVTHTFRTVQLVLEEEKGRVRIAPIVSHAKYKTKPSLVEVLYQTDNDLSEVGGMYCSVSDIERMAEALLDKDTPEGKAELERLKKTLADGRNLVLTKGSQAHSVADHHTTPPDEIGYPKPPKAPAAVLEDTSEARGRRLWNILLSHHISGFDPLGERPSIPGIDWNDTNTWPDNIVEVIREHVSQQRSQNVQPHLSRLSSRSSSENEEQQTHVPSTTRLTE